MQDDPNELRRQIDGLRHQINEMKSVAEADRRAQEAERQMLKSDLKESLTRHEAASKEAIERLRTDMYKAVVVIIGAIGAIIAFVEYGSR